MSGPGEGAWQPRDPQSGAGRGLNTGLRASSASGTSKAGEAEGLSPGHCDKQTTEALVCLHARPRKGHILSLSGITHVPGPAPWRGNKALWGFPPWGPGQGSGACSSELPEPLGRGRTDSSLPITQARQAPKGTPLTASLIHNGETCSGPIHD